jgi:hypothetical protein
MVTLERIHFEDDLIESNSIRLECEKNFQLGLDTLIESLSPREDSEFEPISSRGYAPLDPIHQIPKMTEREGSWVRQCEQLTSELSQAESIAVSRLGNWSEFNNGDDTYRLFRIPEPPYAEFFRNRPPDLRISHLRALREDGYFDDHEPEVQIAAYLISKGHWQHYSVTNFFSHLISWQKFLSAQSKVHHHIRITWPKRFQRIESVKATLSKKQILAFDTRHDIDLAPTIKDAAAALGLSTSSLNERLSRLKTKLRSEFKEFLSIEKRPASWSQKCDIDVGGFFRKSLALLENSPLINPDGTKYFVNESKHIDVNIYSYKKCEDIKAELKKRYYPPELKTVMGSANRGNYDVRRGEYHHHVEEQRFIELWKKIYFLTDYSDEESSVFANAIIKREDEGCSIFSMRHRLRMVRKRRAANRQPFGRFARAPIEASLALALPVRTKIPAADNINDSKSLEFG